MLAKDSKLAVVVADYNLRELVRECLSSEKYKNIEYFVSFHDAYERCSRIQFSFLIIDMKLPDSPGVVLMQRLKSTGNYGTEPMFFIGKSVDEATFNMFLEYDVDYVLTGVPDRKRLIQKLQFIFKHENHLRPSVETYRLAKSALLGNKLGYAKDLAKQLVENKQDNERVHILLGDIALKEGNIDETQDSLEDALKLNPKSIGARLRIAKIKMTQGNLSEAKTILDELVSLNPHYLNGLENAGLNNFELGFNDLAREQMESLEKLDETNKNANQVLGEIALQDGDFAAGIKRLQKFRSEAELVKELNKAGVQLTKDDDFEDAIKLYQECLKVVNNDKYRSKISYNLAFAYYKLKDYNLSIKFCDQALKADPELNHAKKLLAQLEKVASKAG